MSPPNHRKIVLEPGALLVDSIVRGGLYLERYSGINRCEVLGPAGVGSFSWVSDTNVGAFVHIGARSAVGGFEHPLDRATTSSFQWGQNSALLTLDSGSLAEIHPMNVKPANPTTLIESDVWIGANAIVLAGVKLAVGSVVGAGSVLTRDTQAYGVYVGSPARLIRYRFERDLCEKLIASEWWRAPIEFLLSLDLTDPLGTAVACMEYWDSPRARRWAGS
jgi:acetyltransferase-like isoleucine patch superfamily enzyme